jgi:glycosyltransferase involved in cell wall biosynthesis
MDSFGTPQQLGTPERARQSGGSLLMVLEALFPAPRGGGAENQVRTLATHFVQRGVEVTLVVPMLKWGPQVAQEDIDGIRVIRLRYPKIPILGNAVLLARLALYLKRERRRYTAVHVHIANNMASVCALLAPLIRIRVIIKPTGMTELLDGILASHPSLAARMKRRAMRGAAAFQATSSQLARELVAAGFARERVQLIPNSVDTGRFERTQRDAALRDRLCGTAHFVGVFVGRIAPEKGIDILLRAWASAFDKRDDTRLILVGDGAELPELKRMSERLGLAGRVIFVGHSDSVEAYMHIADVGILPSRFEGLSNTMLEYMACGLPVVASRVSGAEDFVLPGRTGWLFPIEDEAGLTACLRATEAAALDGKLAPLGRQARALVQSHASIQAVSDRLLALYGIRAEPLDRVGEQ